LGKLKKGNIPKTSIALKKESGESRRDSSTQPLELEKRRGSDLWVSLAAARTKSAQKNCHRKKGKSSLRHSSPEWVKFDGRGEGKRGGKPALVNESKKRMDKPLRGAGVGAFYFAAQASKRRSRPNR